MKIIIKNYWNFVLKPGTELFCNLKTLKIKKYYNNLNYNEQNKSFINCQFSYGIY